MPTRSHRPPEARCEIRTFKEGLLSRVAHDLAIEVSRFEVQVEEGGSLSAEFEAGSLRCLHAMKKGEPAPRALSEKDRRTIDDSIREEVLGASRMPKIRYSGKVSIDGDRARVEGTLSLHGVERQLACEARRLEGRWEAEVRLHQPDFGIRPFSALMGSLKIKPEIQVRISLPVD